jgi:hypothetical protein
MLSSIMDIRTNPNRILLIANHFLTLIYLRVYCQYSNATSLFSVSSIIQYHGNTIEIILERTLYEILMTMCLFSTIFFNRMQSRRVTQILPSDHFKRRPCPWTASVPAAVGRSIPPWNVDRRVSCSNLTFVSLPRHFWFLFYFGY